MPHQNRLSPRTQRNQLGVHQLPRKQKSDPHDHRLDPHHLLPRHHHWLLLLHPCRKVTANRTLHLPCHQQQLVHLRHLHRLPRHRLRHLLQQIRDGPRPPPHHRLLKTLNHSPIRIPLRPQVLSRHVLHDSPHDPRRLRPQILQLLRTPLRSHRIRNSYVHPQRLLRAPHLAHQPLANTRTHPQKVQPRTQRSHTKRSQQNHGKRTVQHGQKVRRNTRNHVVHIPLRLTRTPWRLPLSHRSLPLLLGRQVQPPPPLQRQLQYRRVTTHIRHETPRFHPHLQTNRRNSLRLSNT